jgi:Xaa-Pro dipeptidase
VYFIEMLLREHRVGPNSSYIDWALVDRLAPFGGVRIEDNVLVTAAGHRNLTRPHI